jgi:hypothetical protein
MRDEIYSIIFCCFFFFIYDMRYTGYSNRNRMKLSNILNFQRNKKMKQSHCLRSGIKAEMRKAYLTPVK